MRMVNILVKSDLVSKRVGSQKFPSKRLASCWVFAKVKKMTSLFKQFLLIFVPKDQNLRVDLLSKLDNTKQLGYHWLVIQENLEY